MATRALLLASVYVFCMMVGTGEGIQCYVDHCSNSTVGGTSCQQAQQKLTCGKMPGTDLLMDRCVTQRVKMFMNGMTMYQQIRNCSHSLQCTPAMRDLFCNATNTTGAVESCEMGCCEGDLCNDGHVIPTFPPPGPSGADLDCYSCATVYIPGISVPQTSCSTPSRQNCAGYGMIPNMAQDRCITIKIDGGVMGSHEVRNCSSQYFCSTDLMCKTANASGMLKSCDVKCCSGRYCNGDSNPITTPSATPVNATAANPTSTVKSSAVPKLYNIWCMIPVLIAARMI